MDADNLRGDSDKLAKGQSDMKEQKQYLQETTVSGTIAKKLEASYYVTAEGTEGSEIEKEVRGKVIVEDWRYGISKARRITIKGKISYDRD